MSPFRSASLVNQQASDSFWEVLIDWEVLCHNEILQKTFFDRSVAWNLDRSVSDVSRQWALFFKHFVYLLVEWIWVGFCSFVNLLDSGFWKDCFYVFFVGDFCASWRFMIFGKGLLDELLCVFGCSKTCIDLFVSFLNVFSWNVEVCQTCDIHIFSFESGSSETQIVSDVVSQSR